jgi:hypothetical protein
MSMHSSTCLFNKFYDASTDLYASHISDKQESEFWVYGIVNELQEFGMCNFLFLFCFPQYTA